MMLYKYRSFDQNALSSLINRTLYFAEPMSLNDPYDCHIGIMTALKSVFSRDDIREIILGKLSEPKELECDPEELLGNIEERLRGLGILCLSKEKLNAVMWSHYANIHKGFCIGFDFSEKFTDFYKSNGIFGAHECVYPATNPFLSYLTKPTAPEEKLKYDLLVMTLLLLGASAKSEGWKYENEVRIIKKKPGEVTFEPAELREIIFGMKMDNRNRRTIKTILSSAEWKHIVYREVNNHEDGFGLRLDPA